MLQQVRLPYVPARDCERMLRDNVPALDGSGFELDPSFVCAGGQANEDTCDGDGGGPLLCPAFDDPTVYVQVGETEMLGRRKRKRKQATKIRGTDLLHCSLLELYQGEEYCRLWLKK